MGRPLLSIVLKEAESHDQDCRCPLCYEPVDTPCCKPSPSCPRSSLVSTVPDRPLTPDTSQHAFHSVSQAVERTLHRLEQLRASIQSLDNVRRPSNAMGPDHSMLVVTSHPDVSSEPGVPTHTVHTTRVPWRRQVQLPSFSNRNEPFSVFPGGIRIDPLFRTPSYTRYGPLSDYSVPERPYQRSHSPELAADNDRFAGESVGLSDSSLTSLGRRVADRGRPYPNRGSQTRTPSTGVSFRRRPNARRLRELSSVSYLSLMEEMDALLENPDQANAIPSFRPTGYDSPSINVLPLPPSSFEFTPTVVDVPITQSQQEEGPTSVGVLDASFQDFEENAPPRVRIPRRQSLEPILYAEFAPEAGHIPDDDIPCDDLES